MWRADVAERHLDCTPMVAVAIAIDPLVDVCTARELVRHGCPPEAAIALATRVEPAAPHLRLRSGTSRRNS